MYIAGMGCMHSWCWRELNVSIIIISILIFLGSLVKIQLLFLMNQEVLAVLFCLLCSSENPTNSAHRRRAKTSRDETQFACERGEFCLRHLKYHERLKIKVIFVFGVQLWNIWPQAQWLPGTFSFIIWWYKVSRTLILHCKNETQWMLPLVL